MTDITSGDRTIRLADKHTRYSGEMRRYFDMYFNAVVPRDEDGRQVADFSQSSIHTRRENGLQFLLPSIPEGFGMVAEYFKHAQGCHLAFDIGAYCGLSTYELSKRYSRVVSFEPDPENHQCLISNIERHGMRNVEVVQSAMSADWGEAMFFGEGSVGSRLALPEYTRPPIFSVSTLSLADACMRYGLPDFVIMDIEGAEVQVLESSRDLLSRNTISLAIDTGHDEANGWTYGRVESILRDCGYEVETGTPGGFYTTWAWKV